MKALIVDDEPWARFEMERLLAPYSWLTIVGQAASASEAINYLEREDLDAIFLDVQMRDGDGFSVLPSLPDPAPKIIFTTAYSNFAVRAFEVNALDYLLKPIAPDRLAKAMSRLVEPSNEPRAEKDLQGDDHIFVQDGGGWWVVTVRVGADDPAARSRRRLYQSLFWATCALNSSNRERSGEPPAG